MKNLNGWTILALDLRGFFYCRIRSTNSIFKYRFTSDHVLSMFNCQYDKRRYMELFWRTKRQKYNGMVRPLWNWMTRYVMGMDTLCICFYICQYWRLFSGLLKKTSVLYVALKVNSTTWIFISLRLLDSRYSILRIRSTWFKLFYSIYANLLGVWITFQLLGRRNEVKFV